MSGAGGAEALALPEAGVGEGTSVGLDCVTSPPSDVAAAAVPARESGSKIRACSSTCPALRAREDQGINESYLVEYTNPQSLT